MSLYEAKPRIYEVVYSLPTLPHPPYFGHIGLHQGLCLKTRGDKGNRPWWPNRKSETFTTTTYFRKEFVKRPLYPTMTIDNELATIAPPSSSYHLLFVC